jgi:hypothetical protein
VLRQDGRARLPAGRVNLDHAGRTGLRRERLDLHGHVDEALITNSERDLLPRALLVLRALQD